MFHSLIKSLFISVPMLLGMAIYYTFDKSYNITDKISLKIKVDKKWQPFLVVCFSFAQLILFGILCIYLIDIPTTVFFIMFGIVIGFANKLQNQIKDK